MKKVLAASFVMGLLATTSAFAQYVPYYPQTLPASTVIGRLPGSAGPSEAIPFSTFFAYGLLVPGTQQISPTTNGGLLWDNDGFLADSLVPLQIALPVTSNLYKGTGNAGVAQAATPGTDYVTPSGQTTALATALPSTSALYKGTGGAGIAQAATVGTDYAAPGTAQNWTATQTFSEVIGTVTPQSGTTYTFAATDCGTEVVFSNGSAVTATIPATLPAGCNIAILQAGAGKVSVNGSAVTPATLHSAHSYTGTYAQWSIIGINIETNSGGSSAIAVLTGDGA